MSLLHTNVQAFYGIGVNDENVCQFMIGEMCSKGHLPCLLQSKSINLDDTFKNSLMTDLVSVRACYMQMAHKSNLMWILMQLILLGDI